MTPGSMYSYLISTFSHNFSSICLQQLPPELFQNQPEHITRSILLTTHFLRKNKVDIESLTDAHEPSDLCQFSEVLVYLFFTSLLPYPHSSFLLHSF